MAEKILFVIDMLNDFIRQEGKLSCGEDAEQIVPFVTSKVREFLGEGYPVVFIKDAHMVDDYEFNRFPTHCVKETWGADLIEELYPYEVDPKAYCVEKQRYSAFYGTNLEEILSAVKPKEVYVVGVCTNICVLYTVEELCNRDYNVYVFRQGVASFDSGAHGFALQQMENVLGAEIL
ncbi:MAG: isochorismatase family cysteine hydrolase [Bacillota bacterium]